MSAVEEKSCHFSDMKSQHPNQDFTDPTFNDMVPFVDWTQPMSDWANPGTSPCGTQFDSPVHQQASTVLPHHHNNTTGLQGHHHQQSSLQSHQTDMRVLGVDLDMLMQHSEPFYTSTPTPPPSPDSSSSCSTFDGSHVTTNVIMKANSMTFERVRTTNGSGNPAPHHMACHDYTNKVCFVIK